MLPHAAPAADWVPGHAGAGSCGQNTACKPSPCWKKGPLLKNELLKQKEQATQGPILHHFNTKAVTPEPHTRKTQDLHKSAKSHYFLKPSATFAPMLLPARCTGQQAQGCAVKATATGHPQARGSHGSPLCKKFVVGSKICCTPDGGGERTATA